VFACFAQSGKSWSKAFAVFATNNFLVVHLSLAEVYVELEAHYPMSTFGSYEADNFGTVSTIILLSTIMTSRYAKKQKETTEFSMLL
jgi:hypothetical protein